MPKLRTTTVSPATIRERQRLGIDKYDEIWDGVYFIPPPVKIDQQDMVMGFCCLLHDIISVPHLGRVFPGANVSDRDSDWLQNVRCPAVVVVLKTGSAVDRKTHWQGGPDFLIEFSRPGCRTYDKLDFYGQIGVRELLVVERATRALRLYRHDGSALALVGQRGTLVSQVVPLSFRRKSSRGQVEIEVKRTDRVEQTWVV